MRAHGCAVAIGVVGMVAAVVCWPVIALAQWVGRLFGRVRKLFTTDKEV